MKVDTDIPWTIFLGLYDFYFDIEYTFRYRLHINVLNIVGIGRLPRFNNLNLSFIINYFPILYMLVHDFVTFFFFLQFFQYFIEAAFYVSTTLKC